MDYIFRRAAACALILAGVGVLPAFAGTITAGTGTTSNSFPFGDPNYIGEYQQVYDASIFSGAVQITQLSFFAGPGFPSDTITGNYTLRLSTTNVGVGSLSTTYATNIGPDNTLFFSGAVNHVLSFAGAPYLFDPSQGNLLLDVFVNTGNSTLSRFAAGCSVQTNRVFNFSGNSNSHGIGASPGQCTPNEYGLETQFTFTAAAIPEPPALPMFGSALLALIGWGALGRRKPSRA
jgi:hypothetical protein